MEWAWAGAGDSPRGRAEPGPGVASPPMPPRPSAPVLRGSRRGPPRVRGWAMGGGRWGGGAGPSGRGTGSSYRGPVPPVSCPSGWPAAAIGVGVPPWRRTRPARRRPAAAGAGACGAIRSAAGRIAIVRLVVEWPSRHWPCVAVPGGGPWWPARGSVPRWRAWAGTGLAVGPSPMRVSPKCRPCALSCHPAAPCGAGAAARALRARWPSVFGLAAAGAVPHSHRGAPVRPACRRGVAVGVAAAMIPVRSDPPAPCRRAAVLQFAAEKDYPGACDHSDSAAPRRGDPRFVRRITSTRTRTVTSIILRA